nr:hypothetical protein [Tanacetum cinerariifolium]
CKSGDEYYDVPPPYTRTCIPPKLDLVFHDTPTVNETVITTFNVELSPTKPAKICLNPIGPLPLLLKTGSLTKKIILRVSI